MDDAPARPPRPRPSVQLEQTDGQDRSRELSAWLVKKRSGIGSIFGKDRWYFTLDYAAHTLSWAKRPEEKAEMTLGFKEFKRVEAWSKHESESTVETAEETADASRRPSSRSSVRSGISNISARIRSLSPFRRPKTAEHGVIVCTGERSIELTCESKDQSDQWLAALQAAMAQGGGMTSPKAAATYVDFVSPVRTVVVASRMAADESHDGVPHVDEATECKPAAAAVERAVLQAPQGDVRKEEACFSPASRLQRQTDCDVSHCPTPVRVSPSDGRTQLDPEECIRAVLESNSQAAPAPVGRKKNKPQLESCWEGISLDDALGPKPKPPRRTFAASEEQASTPIDPGAAPSRRKPPAVPDCWAGVSLGDALGTKAASAEGTTGAVESSSCNGEAPKDADGSPDVQMKVMEDLDNGALGQMCSPKGASSQASDNQSSKRTSQCDLAIDAPRKTPKSAEELDEEAAETRKMFDKRELRRRNRTVFEKHVSTWREKQLQPVRGGPAGLDSQRIRVCVRKRPLFSHEDGEFDVVSVRSPQLIVHNCLTKADLKSLFVGHMGFNFARVFDEQVTDSEVYAQCGEPAVQYARGGGSAAIFMFGQTGSGKTHTMQALLSRASEQLYEDQNFDQLWVGAFEIAGKALRDLQDPENPGKELKVMVDTVNEIPGQLEHSSKVATKIHGLKWCSAQSADQLLQLCKDAQGRRTTRATQANKVSSRSHSVLRIGRSEDDVILTLVDCAGSERNEDSTHHSAQDRKDAADINSTIFALKECFRVMRAGNGQQPPFRNSLLTRVLADSLTSEDAKVVAVGTVSPAARDTEHSIETLKSLQMLQGTQMTFEKREDIRDESWGQVKHPRTWSEDEVRQWLGAAAEGQAEPFVSGLSKGTDGKVFVRWPAARFSQLCGGSKELGEVLFKQLREQMKAADESRRKK
eukprot:TRINITY_DN23486_c0_g1_i1.p1 TRINITY_DN23486_c0_g1~~TRINITY_DN23486_c0_g1_i1.p1  ORF type:complete len:927 (-),score=212.46 TRINITY_DN23486_c0_g1_i1:95-2875(-)